MWCTYSISVFAIFVCRSGSKHDQQPLTLQQRCWCSSWGGCRRGSRSCTALCPRGCWCCDRQQQHAKSWNCGRAKHDDFYSLQIFSSSCKIETDGWNQSNFNLRCLCYALKSTGNKCSPLSEHLSCYFIGITAVLRLSSFSVNNETHTGPHSEQQSWPILSWSGFLHRCGKSCCQICTEERSNETTRDGIKTTGNWTTHIYAKCFLAAFLKDA